MSDYIKKQDVLDILYNTFEEYNMTTDKQDKHGGFGAEVFKRVKEQPTFDEKEITRKAMERIIKRFEEEIKQNPEASLREYRAGLYKAIEIAAKVGGIE